MTIHKISDYVFFTFSKKLLEMVNFEMVNGNIYRLYLKNNPNIEEFDDDLYVCVDKFKQLLVDKGILE